MASRDGGMGAALRDWPMQEADSTVARHPAFRYWAGRMALRTGDGGSSHLHILGLQTMLREGVAPSCASSDAMASRISARLRYSTDFDS
jgi:hypothetical protein